jgi:hypothetical protein
MKYKIGVTMSFWQMLEVEAKNREDAEHTAFYLFDRDKATMGDGEIFHSEQLKGNNLTPEQQTFMDAYGKCMAVAPDHEIEYFFEHKDKTQVGTFREQQLVREGITCWGHIEDAWLLWQEAHKSKKETS